jgi:hypothetical protein
MKKKVRIEFISVDFLFGCLFIYIYIFIISDRILAEIRNLLAPSETRSQFASSVQSSGLLQTLTEVSLLLSSPFSPTHPRILSIFYYFILC